MIDPLVRFWLYLSYYRKRLRTTAAVKPEVQVLKTLKPENSGNMAAVKTKHSSLKITVCVT
jgi:hypothetical protein